MFGPYSIYKINYGDCEWDEWIPLQYVNQKDKNGKEVYEGDIIEGLHDLGPGGFHKMKGVIEWRNDSYGMNYWEDYEVIGNIYENEKVQVF